MIRHRTARLVIVLPVLNSCFVAAQQAGPQRERLSRCVHAFYYPWYGKNTRSREGRDYYDREFMAAIAAFPDLIGISSFNEWHEGTQIEPAVPKTIDGHRYEDYAPRDRNYYLDRTRFWVDKCETIVVR